MICQYGSIFRYVCNVLQMFFPKINLQITRAEGGQAGVVERKNILGVCLSFFTPWASPAFKRPVQL